MDVAAARRGSLAWVASILFVACLCGLTGIVVVFLSILIRHDFALHIGALLEKTGPSELTASVLMIGLTPIVFMGCWKACSKGMSPGQRGLLAGLTFGLWALTCAITVPYVGAYPVAWAVIPSLVFGWGSSGLGFWLSLYLLNLIACPMTGMLYFRRMARWRQRLNLQSHQDP